MLIREPQSSLAEVSNCGEGFICRAIGGNEIEVNMPAGKSPVQARQKAQQASTWKFLGVPKVQNDELPPSSYSRNLIGGNMHNL